MIDIQEIRHKSIKGVISLTMRTIVLQAVSLVGALFLGYYLSPSDFGVYAVVLSTMSLFTFISDVGLAATLVQKKDEPTLEELRTTFTVQQFLATVIFAIVVVLSPVWKSQNGMNRDGLFLLYALAFSFFLASLKTIPSILLERKLEFNKIVVPQIVETILFNGIVVVLAAKGFGVSSYTYAVLARSIGGIVTIYMFQRWQIGLNFSKKIFRELLKFGMKFQLNDLIATVKDDLLIVVLARFLPLAQIGYINWAKRWSVVPYSSSVANIMAVTFPTFSRLQDHPEKLKRGIEKSLFFIAFIVFPILAGIIILSLPLTNVIPKYQKWQPALPALYFFCINIAWASVSTPLTNALNAIGHIDKTLKLMIMWTGLTWTLTPLCIILFKFTGVAIASALVASTSIVTVWMLKKHVKIDFFDQIWRQLAASIAMLLFLFVTRNMWQSSFIKIALSAAAGAAVYGAVLIAIGYKKVSIEIHSLGIRLL